MVAPACRASVFNTARAVGSGPSLFRHLLASLLLCALAAPHLRADGPITYSRVTVAGVVLHVLDVDLNDPRVLVSPAIAAAGIGRTEPLADFARRLRPAAIINGTFFSKTTLHPVGDILIDGKLIHFGGMGTALAFSADGVDCVRLPKSRHVDWSHHRAALAAGPLLVWNGFAKPLPGGEGFGDPGLFARATPRSAAGVTQENHLLLVTTARGTCLSNLAVAMRGLGARYAVNLDGGASAGMWHDGRMIRAPSNALTNVLCVYLKPDPDPSRNLRPPRGLDWRAGHPPRPSLSFPAEHLRITALLPRKWQGEQPLWIEADNSLPDGWTVSVRLDHQPVALARDLPAEIILDLSELEGPNPKHSLSIEVLDTDGKALGRTERIFQIGPDVW